MADLLVLYISHEKLLSSVTRICIAFTLPKQFGLPAFTLLRQLFYPPAVYADHTRGTRSSEMPILFFLFDLGPSLRSQGSGSSLYPLPSFISSSSVCFLWWPMLCVEVFWPCLDERRRKAVSDWILDLQYDIVPVVLGPPSICLSSGKVHKT